MRKARALQIAPTTTPAARKPVQLWQTLQIRWDFLTNVYGGFPAARSTLDPFIAKKIKDQKITPAISVEATPEGRVEVRAETPSIEELHRRRVEEALETLPTETELTEERTLVFRRHPQTKALVMWGGSIRAHLKECARTVSTLVMPRVEGTKSLSVRATNGLYVRDNWVQLMRDGEPLFKHDDVEEFFVHAVDFRTGTPLNSIKRCELIEPEVSMSFTLMVLGGIVSLQELEAVLSYGALHGFGQERSRGMGRYSYNITESETDAVE